MEHAPLLNKFRQHGDLPKVYERDQISDFTTLFTVGYGGKEPKYFIDLMRDNKILIVFDIRIQPYYAFCNEFKFTFLKEALNKYKIKLIWRAELGNPFFNRTNGLELYHAYFMKVGDMLIYDLPEIIARSNVALMCSHKSAMNCHRKIIADFIKDRFNWRVKHLE